MSMMLKIWRIFTEAFKKKRTAGFHKETSAHEAKRWRESTISETGFGTCMSTNRE